MADSTNPGWQTQAAAIKARTLSKIPPDAIIPTDNLPTCVIDLNLTGAHLTPLEREIIQLDATDLRDRLADRSYTAAQVIGAFIKSAAVAHQVTNCLTDLFADEALKRARWLDEQYEVTGKPVGPLHGVPISVKVCFLFGMQVKANLSALQQDQIDIIGKDSAAGFLGQGQPRRRITFALPEPLYLLP